MLLVRWIAARLLLLGLFGPSQRSRSMRARGGSRSGRRGRFGLFPMPNYTRRTRRGSFSMGGCCLPLTIGILSTPIAAMRLLRYRLRR